MTMAADINKRVDQYVKLRDHIKALKDANKKALAPFEETLEQLNSVLLAHLSSLNVDSAATGAGTVYRTDKKAAGLADKAAFWNYVLNNKAFDLLDYKANVTAVEDFIANNKAPPPGVNYSVTHVVGVRRAG
jgi:hypothetical protein